MRSALTRRALRCSKPQAPITHHHLAISQSISRIPARHASTSASDSPHAGSSSRPGPDAKTRPKRRSRAVPLLSLGAVGAACYAFYGTSSSSGGGGGVLNDVTFVPYSITAKEVISPTSFILTVRPRQHSAALPYLEPGSAAWKLAQWSVEFKQPAAQIARHYTPLPGDGDGDKGGNGKGNGNGNGNGNGDGDSVDRALRFYIRAIGGGEMSSYIGRLPLGADVWLRGPHAGFDVLARLGGARDVVFLAGGTGVAPGVQVARAVLDGAPAARVRLLWAVRHRSELQDGGPRAAKRSKRSWWMPWRGGAEPEELGEGEMRGVARQLADMKRRYGARLSVQVAVDDEGARFSEAHLRRALVREGDAHAHAHGGAGAGAGAGAGGSAGCGLHDAGLLERACEYEDPGALRCGDTPV
ncbi:Cytochrome c mitochondrial import factor CYC2 [Escovopsis weberi]|uniref:Cytochrome c mitochondrial import factor CYC2 n=1 Tax=Escovopsis weberi TaxID=150374 RepID=A0A0M8N713_ESCWE|nr:Cytochrome c mitochondrial import factor CYC2 [Escovopsis weberi]